MGPDTSWMLIFAGAILGTFILLFFAFWFIWRYSYSMMGSSPYTGSPLRRATDLSYYTAERTLRYLHDLRQYDNRIFKLSKAAYCRETGRIFTDCVNIFDVIRVDWSFLNKRLPGAYVSWGSLTPDQQRDVRNKHASLDGFQTEHSSPTPIPRMVEPEFAYSRPGPLYVNFETKVLLGWKNVPGTDVEVLIVQRPIK